ncbi:NIMA related kinase 1, putative [Babesia caballi]|uniref:non-specific serine/threonine protein kinase n=1 Tax=Babesia caballi TaxID=5871 RepID=A0AAV4LYJ9_BABCB|nr:NIMA related kinase 1, putative [Babesia caballi]
MASEDERLMQFKILRRIGAGRFGEVFQVQHKATGELFCWKVVAYHGLTEKEKEQLVMEVNVMRDLKHPNIVRYVDRVVDRKKHLLYIIMEYCDSGDLAENMRQFHKHYDKVNEQVIFDIALQLLFALAYCHNSSLGPKHGRILHRDLKPQNIFLHSNRQNKVRNGFVCKIGDFGLCRSIGMESFAHSCVGTPYYWCPELLLSHSKNYDDKMDMWALGVVLYELSYGKTPFHQATTLAELAQQMKSGVPLPLAGRSRQLNTLLYALLQQDPARRASAVQCLGLGIWDGPVSDWFWDTVNPRDRERIYENIIRRNAQRIPLSSQLLSDFVGDDASHMRTCTPQRSGRMDVRATTEFVESDDEEGQTVAVLSTPRNTLMKSAGSISHSMPSTGSPREADIASHYRGLSQQRTPVNAEFAETPLPLYCRVPSFARHAERRSDSAHSIPEGHHFDLPTDCSVRVVPRRGFQVEAVTPQYFRTPTQVRYAQRGLSRVGEDTVYARAADSVYSADSQATTFVRRPERYRPMFRDSVTPVASYCASPPHTDSGGLPRSIGGTTICSRRRYMKDSNIP